MECSYKFRIYPNREQENLIQHTFGCCRYVYNYYLAMRKDAYEQSGETMNFYACNRNLTLLKKQEDTLWLKEVDSMALQNSIRDLDLAYQNFFRRVKGGDKPGYPRFKSKKDNRKSYKSSFINGNIKVLDKAIQLPKLGMVKCRVSRYVQGRILNATVSQTPSGKYFVSICCSDVDIRPRPKTGEVVGLMLGGDSFATSSNGVEYPNPRCLAASQKKLVRLQRRLSRKSKDSANSEKARIRLARLHEHVANQRMDMLHKLSTDIVRQNDVICVEKLPLLDMAKNHADAKDIVDAGWGEFLRLLSYKAAWYGKVVALVSDSYPSGQICSHCGAVWDDTQDYEGRKLKCPGCGTVLIRDHNAAINILDEGLRKLA